jgi:hypothetical protein
MLMMVLLLLLLLLLLLIIMMMMMILLMTMTVTMVMMMMTHRPAQRGELLPEVGVPFRGHHHGQPHDPPLSLLRPWLLLLQQRPQVGQVAGRVGEVLLEQRGGQEDQHRPGLPDLRQGKQARGQSGAGRVRRPNNDKHTYTPSSAEMMTPRSNRR